MTLPIPNIDDQTYADLMQEVQALIPTYAPFWTNHNASDPGITLLELFAWLAEMLIYRTNRVTDQHTQTFLKLLNGPASRYLVTDAAIQSLMDSGAGNDVVTALSHLKNRPILGQAKFLGLLQALLGMGFTAEVQALAQQSVTPDPQLADQVRTTVLTLRQQDRAITTADYEALAREVAPDSIARVTGLPLLNLALGTEPERAIQRPGHISVVLVPNTTIIDPPPQPSPQLCQQVWSYLDPLRVLTTRHHVVGPVYVPVGAELLVARRADMPEQQLRDCLTKAFTKYLHPLTGGPDHTGWLFGRSIYLSELVAFFESLSGVDHIPDLLLTSSEVTGAPRSAVATELWHEEGDFVGLGLASYHLPQLTLDPAKIVIGTTFVPVQVTVRVTPAPTIDPVVVRRAVKMAVRRFFHPLYGGPKNGDASRAITAGDLRLVIRALPEVESLHDLEVHPLGQSGDVHVSQDELVEVQTDVTVTTTA